MTKKVVFIDDEKNSRDVYQDVLQEMYGDECEVIAIEPSRSIGDMTNVISDIDDVVSIVIDEKLKVGLGVSYQGSQLVEAIRALDSKLPLYILTSEIGLIEPPFGSVEYIIDKNEVGKDAYRDECAMLMRRHINSYNDIKTERAKRFDELLRASIERGLSDAESREYEELDFVRVKKVLSTEVVINTEELDRQQTLLSEIENKLKLLRGEL